MSRHPHDREVLDEVRALRCDLALVERRLTTKILRILAYLHRVLPANAVDVLLTATGDHPMPIVTEFDLVVGKTATLTLHPVAADETTPASIETIVFVSSDPVACPLTPTADPLVFTCGPPTVGNDFNLSLSCDGHVGDGVTQINKTYVCHGKAVDASDVLLDVVQDD